jgi:hypothetical protein
MCPWRHIPLFSRTSFLNSREPIDKREGLIAFGRKNWNYVIWISTLK